MPVGTVNTSLRNLKAVDRTALMNKYALKLNAMNEKCLDTTVMFLNFRKTCKNLKLQSNLNLNGSLKTHDL